LHTENDSEPQRNTVHLDQMLYQLTFVLGIPSSTIGIR